MVTLAAKELLRNSINTANFHNKILEENDMWRQWELEQGLTMMVSDDVVKRRIKHRCKYHEKKRREKLEKEKEKLRKRRDPSKPVPTVSKAETLERWDHGGFKELYPEDSDEKSHKKQTESKHSCYKRDSQRRLKERNRRDSPDRQSSSSLVSSIDRKSHADKKQWDHGGYKELYPDEFSESRSSSSSGERHKSRKHYRAKTKRRRRNTSSSSSTTASRSSASPRRTDLSRRKRSRSSSSHNSHSRETSSVSSGVRYTSSSSSRSSQTKHKRLSNKLPRYNVSYKKKNDSS